MKNQRQKYLGVKLYLAACLLFGISLSSCRTPPAPKPPMLFVAEDGALVLPAGNVITLPDGRAITTKVDFLMMSESVVSNLQARGYLPGVEF